MIRGLKMIRFARMSVRLWLTSCLVPLCYRWRRYWPSMNWACPRCTTHRAALRWMVRACSPAWRNSTRWSWRGRRCSDTARRRDEAEDCSGAGNRDYFLNHHLSEDLLSSRACDTFGTSGGETRGKLFSPSDKLGCLQPSSNFSSEVCANCEELLSPSRHWTDLPPLGLFLLLSTLPSPHLPFLKVHHRVTYSSGRNNRGKPVQYTYDEHSLMHSLQYWRIFCTTTFTNCSA